jgi:DNA-directed RNA polymerase subunit RPC12/RpoP
MDAAQQTAADNECIICNAEFEQDAPAWTCPTCHHTICLQCAQHWFGSYLSYVIPDNDGDVPYVHTSEERNTSCPYCRANVSGDGYAPDEYDIEPEEEEAEEYVFTYEFEGQSMHTAEYLSEINKTFFVNPEDEMNEEEVAEWCHSEL